MQDPIRAVTDSESPCKAPLNPSVGDGGPPRVRTGSNGVQKPLYVDCSVEYELPMVPKIPSDSQPLLVIHPGWAQKRRVTRSSSQQRMLAEQQQRVALQHHQHHYLQAMQSMQDCSNPHQTANSTTTSRKRSYQQAVSSQQPQIQSQPAMRYNPQPHRQVQPRPMPPVSGKYLLILCLF